MRHAQFDTEFFQQVDFFNGRRLFLWAQAADELFDGAIARGSFIKEYAPLFHLYYISRMIYLSTVNSFAYSVCFSICIAACSMMAHSMRLRKSSQPYLYTPRTLPVAW